MYMGATNSSVMKNYTGSAWGAEWKSVMFMVLCPDSTRCGMIEFLNEVRQNFLDCGKELGINGTPADGVDLVRLPAESLTIKTGNKAFFSFRWLKGSASDECLERAIRNNSAQQSRGQLIPILN